MQYHVYMAENSTGKQRSLLGVVAKGVPLAAFRKNSSWVTGLAVEVHNFSIAAETPLSNYSHFLIYSSSSLAEFETQLRFFLFTRPLRSTTPVALLIFDAVASVSEIQFEDRVPWRSLASIAFGSPYVWAVSKEGSPKRL